MILGLEQEIHKMSLKYLIVPENKIILKKPNENKNLILL